MLDRESAARFIENQLDADYDSNRKLCWHYGKMDLRDLLDAIYEGPPSRQSELLFKQEGE